MNIIVLILIWSVLGVFLAFTTYHWDAFFGSRTKRKIDKVAEERMNEYFSYLQYENKILKKENERLQKKVEYFKNKRGRK